MSENISLEKSKQCRFTKKIKNVKKQVASGKIVVKENIRKIKRSDEHGVVYVGHVPHGFYEKEMHAYLSQFGKVRNLVICRSHRSGRSKGFAFVEFESDDVAKIVAETMHNYLMFNRRLTANYIPFEKRPLGLFKGKVTTDKNYSLKMRRNRQNRQKNTNYDETTRLERTQKQLAKLNYKLNKLKELGVNYGFKPVDVPEEILKDKISDQQKNTLKKEQKTDLKKNGSDSNEPTNKKLQTTTEKQTKNKATVKRLQTKTAESDTKKNTKLRSITKKKDSIKPLPVNKKTFKLAVETILNDDSTMITRGKRKASSVATKRVIKTKK